MGHHTPKSSDMGCVLGCMLPLPLHTTIPLHLSREPRDPVPLLGLLSPTSSKVTHLGCCNRWSWRPPVEAGVGRGMGQGPGLRSFP